MKKERIIPEYILCDNAKYATLRKYNNFLVGRVTKLFHIKKKFLLQVISNGRQYKCRMENTACNYSEIKNCLQVGDIMCGLYEKTTDKYGKCEFQINTMYIVTPCFLNEIDTGLLPGNQFTLEKKKRFFHTYLSSDNMCSLRIIIQDRILRSLRHFLQGNGYVECFTPVLQKNFFGGNARPFITHMKDNGDDVYLRLTSEIALKHYIAGGFDKVYEIGHSFRNGNANSKSLVPFMAAEIYTAYSNEEENIQFMKNIFKTLINGLEETLCEYDVAISPYIKTDIESVSFLDYFKTKTGIDFLHEKEKVKNLLHTTFEYDINDENYIKEVYKYFKNKMIVNQIEPIVITDLPSGISPLIQSKNEHCLYRSYLIVHGATLMESTIGKKDVEELTEALNRQKKLLATKGRQEERDFTTFLHAYRYGMPTTAGLFIGLDRIFPALFGIENIGEYYMKM